MLDTSTWQVERLDVLHDLHLDPENIRLERADPKVEADIIIDLFANEDALSLVGGICKIGFLTHEMPVVVRRGDQYVMAEGNRRLAALKAIQNPHLVPAYTSRIQALVKLLPNRKALSEIDVMIAPSQDEADQFVAVLHTANPRRPWGPVRQATFFRTQLESGRTYSELIERYPLANVKRFVFQFRVVSMFETASYATPELAEYVKSKQWRRGLSTLARIYESKAFRELLGLTMSDDGDVEVGVSKTTFDAVAEVIVQGMYEGSINTRHLNSIHSVRFARLKDELTRIVIGEVAQAEGGSTDEQSSTPDAAKNGRGRPESGTSDQAKGSGGPRRSRRPKRPRHVYLDTSQVRVPDEYPQPFKHFMEELSVLDVQSYPNAGFLMLRAALEKGIKCFADAKGIEIRDTYCDRNGFVQLGHCLDWLHDDIQNSKERRLIQVVDGVRSGKIRYYAVSRNKLNAANHNHLVGVDGDEVVAMWSSIEPLMRYLMKQ